MYEEAIELTRNVNFLTVLNQLQLPKRVFRTNEYVEPAECYQNSSKRLVNLFLYALIYLSRIFYCSINLFKISLHLGIVLKHV